MTAILAARDLSAGYGSVAVLHSLNLEVQPGEVVALLGPNGAGKTTTLMTLCGWLRPQRGTVLWNGQPTRAPLHRRARMGLGFVTETRSIFSSLSVSANLRLGNGDPDRALEMFPELRPLLGQTAGLLSGGEQKMLALGRALSTRPKVLLTDELSLGLAPRVVKRLLETIRSASGDGLATLLVEQNVHQALEVSDRAYVLQRGRIAMEGSSAEIASRVNEVERSYLFGPQDAETAAENVPVERKRRIQSE